MINSPSVYFQNRNLSQRLSKPLLEARRRKLVCSIHSASLLNSKRVAISPS
ncbi:Uncharacterised protein [Vibrio cholerae]|nr:Uncharacterised protein [Vibrio cholerae]